MKKIFTDTYKAVDDEFLKEAKKSRPTLKDGTTATTLLLLNDVLYCANIGDSKVCFWRLVVCFILLLFIQAVVCRQKSGTDEKNLAMQITVDHSPLAFNERMRIQKAGGTVKSVFFTWGEGGYGLSDFIQQNDNTVGMAVYWAFWRCPGRLAMGSLRRTESLAFRTSRS